MKGRSDGLGSSIRRHAENVDRDATSARDHLVAAVDAAGEGGCAAAMEGLRRGMFAFGRYAAEAEAAGGMREMAFFAGLKELAATAVDGYQRACVSPSRRMEQEMRPRPVTTPLLEY